MPGDDDGQVRIAGCTLISMKEATIRYLQNHGGEVIERARRGERITITPATASPWPNSGRYPANR